ncbi:hypothetical protein [Variovorax sp. HW608]|uniref:hypothetical protein n=1 Tax=Variovorax sp. HW608 TaxID=1034889 RepID=UPI000B5AD686|nr:hypothetical protein [Variovorax sp. HW608]
MLASYDAAVADPSDEMTHLYEIEDAMKLRFGNPDKAVAALGFSKAEWDRLHKLCNEAPINQSRHRGARTPPLRDAMPEELEEARSIARRIIDGYLTWLESAV